MPKAHQFFIARKKKINRPLLSNLVRYHTLEYLRAHGYQAKDEPEELEEIDVWNMRNLPNNGIELLYKQSCIRVRKGAEPPLPITGSARDFYQQRFSFSDELEPKIITNLLILYDLNEKLEYEGRLQLLHPISGNRRRVSCDWRKVIDGLGLDLAVPIQSEYANPEDLPLGNDESADQDSKRTKTASNGV